MSFRITVLAFLLLLPSLAFAQAPSLRGKFQDPTSRTAVTGVHIKLTSDEALLRSIHGPFVYSNASPPFWIR